MIVSDESSRARKALAAAEAYIRGRQSPNGGFCFYRSHLIDQPSLADTYHAVASLAQLGREPPARKAITDFVTHARLYGAHYYYFHWQTLQLRDQTELVTPETRERIPARSRCF